LRGVCPLADFFPRHTAEALREEGVRLPKTVGQTVSILGALVIGTVLMRKLCLPHGDDCILDRSDLIIAAFWIPVIIVKYRGTAYRSYTQGNDPKAMYTPTGSFWFFLHTNQLRL
jgi:Bacillus/Clostridium GerA spore germination protein.